jgi:hypothetical protein
LCYNISPFLNLVLDVFYYNVEGGFRLYLFASKKVKPLTGVYAFLSHVLIPELNIILYLDKHFYELLKFDKKNIFYTIGLVRRFVLEDLRK